MAIHEAFYDDEGRVWGVTADPKAPMVVESDDENIETLRQTLEWMLAALHHPVLDMDSIPEDGARGPMDDAHESDGEETARD